MSCQGFPRRLRLLTAGDYRHVFDHADFKVSNLLMARFIDADLRDARFSRANVRAYFMGANCRGALFDGAVLLGADFTNAHLDLRQKFLFWRLRRKKEL